MSAKPPLGWVVKVEHPDGVIFYAVREEHPEAAEDYLREALKLNLTDVCVFKPIERSMFESFRMAVNKVRGPF